MTKTEATRLAKLRLRDGHFAAPEGARVRCARCNMHDVMLYSTSGRLGHSEMVRQLAQTALDCEINDEWGSI